MQYSTKPLRPMNRPIHVRGRVPAGSNTPTHPWDRHYAPVILRHLERSGDEGLAHIRLGRLRFTVPLLLFPGDDAPVWTWPQRIVAPPGYVERVDAMICAAWRAAECWR